MKALFVCLFVVAVCPFLACETGIPYGQGREGYLWQGVAFQFDVPSGTATITNRSAEYKDVRIFQYNESSHKWENILGESHRFFRLRGSTQGGYDSRLVSNVPFDMGKLFELCVRADGQEWVTTFVRLIPDSGGVQGIRTLLILEVDQLSLEVAPPSMAELDLLAQ